MSIITKSDARQYIQILNNSTLTATSSFVWGYDPNNNIDLDWSKTDSSSNASFFRFEARRAPDLSYPN